MLAGHLAVGLAAKHFEPKISLGTVVLAAMLPDFAWCLFMMAGVEQVQFTPGLGAANYLNSTDVYGFWTAIALLSLVWYNNVAGPPPTNAAAAPINSLIFFSLVVAWAYWINRLRPVHGELKFTAAR
jgi:hypothetical protein